MRLPGILLLCVVMAVGCTSQEPSRQDPSTKPRLQQKAGNQRSSNQKNLLVIGVDTLRQDAISPTGNPNVRTPNIDRLARQGTLLSNTIVPVPITAPTFASLFTGLLPRNHGVVNNLYPLAGSQVTLAEILSDIGYKTGAVVSGRVMARASGLAQGFQTYDDKLFKDLAAGESDRLAPETTRLAVEWLQRYAQFRNQPPFFLFLHYIDPHLPYNPDEVDLIDSGLPADLPVLKSENALDGYFGKATITETQREQTRRQYLAQVHRIDRAVGDLMQTLEALKLAGDTVIVFTSDHGEALYERGDYLGHAFSLYQETLLAPTIVTAPAGVESGHVIDHRVRTQDLMPAMLEFLDRPDLFPERLDGAPLGQWLRTPHDWLAWSETMAPEGETDKTAFFSGPFKILTPTTAGAPAGHLPGPLATMGQGIYNLAADPRETMPLTPQGRDALLRKYQQTVRSLPKRDELAIPEIDAERRETLRSIGYLQH